jgi:hypothetical protein
MQQQKLQTEKDLQQDVDAQAVQVEEELLVEQQQDVLQEDHLHDEEGDKLLSKFFSINFVMYY